MSVDGVPQLQRRLKAIGDTGDLLRTLQLSAVAEAKRLVPRQTGFLGRSIAPGAIRGDTAIVRASANYAAHVEFGTRPHVIKPRHAKVLAWPANAGGRRLSGRARRGAAMAFACRVNHPGTRPQPYLIPGAVAALRKGGFKVYVINKWNRAA
jgi:hypothetical protein